jgi:hypothetical protein
MLAENYNGFKVGFAWHKHGGAFGKNMFNAFFRYASLLCPSGRMSANKSFHAINIEKCNTECNAEPHIVIPEFITFLSLRRENAVFGEI